MICSCKTLSLLNIKVSQLQTEQEKKNSREEEETKESTLLAFSQSDNRETLPISIQCYFPIAKLCCQTTWGRGKDMRLLQLSMSAMSTVFQNLVQTLSNDKRKPQKTSTTTKATRTRTTTGENIMQVSQSRAKSNGNVSTQVMPWLLPCALCPGLRFELCPG